MKVSIAVVLFAVAACAAEEYCYKDVLKACAPSKQSTGLPNCNATYGAIGHMQKDLQKYAKHHLIRSFEYLLMSTHFANYQKNRAGFEKVLRDLSDSLWNDGIDLIKYINSRGGEMDFATDVKAEVENNNLELYELGALSRALDVQKELALEAHRIHEGATRRNAAFHDPEISSHIENTFVHKHRDIIRKLSGYTSDLNSMLSGPDASLSLFLFDEYLQKQ